MIKAVYVMDLYMENCPIYTLNKKTNQFEFGNMRFDYNMVVSDDEWYVYHEGSGVN